MFNNWIFWFVEFMKQMNKFMKLNIVKWAL